MSSYAFVTVSTHTLHRSSLNPPHLGLHLLRSFASSVFFALFLPRLSSLHYQYRSRHTRLLYPPLSTIFARHPAGTSTVLKAGSFWSSWRVAGGFDPRLLSLVMRAEHDETDLKTRQDTRVSMLRRAKGSRSARWVHSRVWRPASSFQLVVGPHASLSFLSNLFIRASHTSHYCLRSSHKLC